MTDTINYLDEINSQELRLEKLHKDYSQVMKTVEPQLKAIRTQEAEAHSARMAAINSHFENSTLEDLFDVTKASKLYEFGWANGSGSKEFNAFFTRVLEGTYIYCQSDWTLPPNDEPNSTAAVPNPYVDVPKDYDLDKVEYTASVMAKLNEVNTKILDKATFSLSRQDSYYSTHISRDPRSKQWRVYSSYITLAEDEDLTNLLVEFAD